jgi:hypothetical protein
MTRSEVRVPHRPPIINMAQEQKDNSLKIAAAAVTATFVVAGLGAIFARTPFELVAIVSIEAIILIGTGLILNRTKD